MTLASAPRLLNTNPLSYEARARTLQRAFQALSLVIVSPKERQTLQDWVEAANPKHNTPSRISRACKGRCTIGAGQ